MPEHEGRMYRQDSAPHDAVRRVAALRAMDVFDTPPEPRFEALVDLVCQALHMPICMVSLLDENRQWFKAVRGLPLRETPLDQAFCTHAVAAGAPFVVPDARLDARFAQNPLVEGALGLRFYAGVPLRLSDGQHVGTLCVFDRRPRRFSQSNLGKLEHYARLAESLLHQIEDLRRLTDLGQALRTRTAQVESQRRQIDHQTRLMSRAAALVHIGAWERDLRSGVYAWSPGMYLLHEVDEDFVLTEESLMGFYPPGERRRMTGLIARARKAGTSYQVETQIVTGKGRRRWVRLTSDLDIVEGVPVRRFGMMQDITEEKAAADRIASLAERDVLTGLYNRAFLQAHIDGLAGAARKAEHAFLLLDLDGFKDINDTHGHAAGDECLRRVARRLARAAGRGAVVARIGGDEFAVFTDSGVEARTLARQIRAAVQTPVRWRGQSFQLSVSIGIAHCPPGSAMSSQALFGDADLALYDAKAAGRNCESVYRGELKAEATRRFAILRDIGQALRRGGLQLYYQPKVGLADGSHQGFEALLRWIKEDGTIVAAAAFEPALRDPGLSVEIGEFVLDSALAQAARWRDCGIGFGSIAVNMGAAHFRDRNLGRAILDRIAAANLSPGAIEVEVTEDVFMSRAAGHVLDICRELKAGGLRIAFDDFGTGFASLTHLREFPVDVLKIDRSFISRLGADANTTSIVHAVVDLAHTLDMCVVAEGVETEAQADFLRAVGCDCAQGFLYARPMPAGAAGEYLKTLPARRRA